MSKILIKVNQSRNSTWECPEGFVPATIVQISYKDRAKRTLKVTPKKKASTEIDEERVVRETTDVLFVFKVDVPDTEDQVLAKKSFSVRAKDSAVLLEELERAFGRAVVEESLSGDFDFDCLLHKRLEIETVHHPHFDHYDIPFVAVEGLYRIGEHEAFYPGTRKKKK